jgi:hypothetical protein
MLRESTHGIEAGEAFRLFDCSSVRCAVGRTCANLRELLYVLQTEPPSVLEHHMLRCALDDHFELYEFPNDLARWSWEGLGDRLLAEQLALIDPYQFHSIEELRGALTDVVDARLWTLDRVPWARSGFELPIVSSRLMIYDTGVEVKTPAALFEEFRTMSIRSLYYHVHEARQRSDRDDFSAWLSGHAGMEQVAENIRKIDFYFLSLQQLRVAMIEAFPPEFADAAGETPLMRQRSFHATTRSV